MDVEEEEEEKRKSEDKKKSGRRKISDGDRGYYIPPGAPHQRPAADCEWGRQGWAPTRRITGLVGLGSYWALTT